MTTTPAVRIPAHKHTHTCGQRTARETRLRVLELRLAQRMRLTGAPRDEERLFAVFATITELVRARQHLCHACWCERTPAPEEDHL